MRHRKQTFKINRTSSHRRAMMANMACSLIMEGQVKTTVVRAKQLRRVVERMITLGKRGSLHARRQAIAYLRHPAVARYLFEEVSPTFADRQGGYTRILKTGARRGDAAEMCIVEILNEPVTAKKKAPASQAVEPAEEKPSINDVDTAADGEDGQEAAAEGDEPEEKTE